MVGRKSEARGGREAGGVGVVGRERQAEASRGAVLRIGAPASLMARLPAEEAGGRLGAALDMVERGEAVVAFSLGRLLKKSKERQGRGGSWHAMNALTRTIMAAIGCALLLQKACAPLPTPPAFLPLDGPAVGAGRGLPRRTPIRAIHAGGAWVSARARPSLLNPARRGWRGRVDSDGR